MFFTLVVNFFLIVALIIRSFSINVTIVLYSDSVFLINLIIITLSSFFLAFKKQILLPDISFVEQFSNILLWYFG